MSAHELVEERLDGVDAILLISHEHDLRARFVPTAGMVGASLTHRGEELLAQRGGLATYRERGSTFGIPLLYPWANRLSASSFSLGGRTAELDSEGAPVRRDPNGLPIHGLLAASPHWRVTERAVDSERAAFGSAFDYGAHPELLAAFPFPHRLELLVELSGPALTLRLTLVPGGDVAVPVAFGWHPYLSLPGVAREDWLIELPVRRHAELDERGIPTGRSEPVAIAAGPLGERTYDDLFSELERPAVFGLEGGGRRAEVELGEGYPMAQVYAPPGESYICFEPMTAPTDALVSGNGLRWAAAGERFRASFCVRVLG
jgi:galactose mutarotase-like enzyme